MSSTPAFMRRVLAPLVALIWLFGGVAYLQYALWGRVILYSVHLRIGAAALAALWLFMGAMMARVRRTPGTAGLMVPLVALLAYAIVDAVVVAIRFRYDATYLAFSMNVMYFFWFLLAAIIYVPSGATYGTDEQSRGYEGRAAVMFLVLAVPILVLGGAQHLTGSSILPELDPDARYLRVIYVEFVGGGRRANSIFTSGWAFGEYALFGVLLAAAMWMVGHVSSVIGRIATTLFLVVGLYSIYATLTRSVYLQAAISLLAIYLIARSRKRPGFIVAAMVSIGIIATVGAVYVALVSGPVGGAGILDSSSFYARLVHWAEALSDISGSWLNAIFGTGLIANERFPTTQGLLVDNLYLALVLYGGVVSLVLFVWLLARTMVFAVGEARRRRSPFWLALASFLCAVPASGAFADQHNAPALLTLLVWLIVPPMQGPPAVSHTLAPRSGGQEVGNLGAGETGEAS